MSIGTCVTVCLFSLFFSSSLLVFFCLNSLSCLLVLLLSFFFLFFYLFLSLWKETKKTKIPKRAKDQKTERLEIQKDKNAKRQKYNKTKRQKIQQDKKTKIPKREFKIVMSGQFRTLAMFYERLCFSLYT